MGLWWKRGGCATLPSARRFFLFASRKSWSRLHTHCAQLPLNALSGPPVSVHFFLFVLFSFLTSNFPIHNTANPNPNILSPPSNISPSPLVFCSFRLISSLILYFSINLLFTSSLSFSISLLISLSISPPLTSSLPLSLVLSPSLPLSEVSLYFLPFSLILSISPSISLCFPSN